MRGVDDAAGGRKEAQRRQRRPSAPTPLQRALGLLTRREHSRKELASKLAIRGVAPEDASAAIERLVVAGLQDDSRFAETLVRSRAAAGQGPARIRAELRTHGFDREAIAAAIDGFDGDWAENACDLVRRRFGPGVGDPGTARKAAGFLLRRGFSLEQARAATRIDLTD